MFPKQQYASSGEVLPPSQSAAGEKLPVGFGIEFALVLRARSSLLNSSTSRTSYVISPVDASRYDAKLSALAVDSSLVRLAGESVK